MSNRNEPMPADAWLSLGAQGSHRIIASTATSKGPLYLLDTGSGHFAVRLGEPSKRATIVERYSADEASTAKKAFMRLAEIHA